MTLPTDPVPGEAEVRRTTLGYVVSREFASMAAAQRALDALLAINEAAFIPTRSMVEQFADSVEANRAIDAAGLRHIVLPGASE